MTSASAPAPGPIRASGDELASGESPIGSVEDQRRLVVALRDPSAYPHPVGRVSVVETHISFVLLTGEFAYKLKKALDLGFLDFSTLARRRHFCREEVRLNRRHARDIYLDVVAVSGRIDAPRVGDAGEPLEYLVKMRQFDDALLFEHLLARDGLQPRHVDALADRVAAFHAEAARAGEDHDYGSALAVREPMEQNFSQLRPLLRDAMALARLDAVQAWSRAEWVRLRPLIDRRRKHGAVRECHGDLHLGNVALIDGEPVLFDCIEFNPEFRWTDVMAEIAFMAMELAHHGRPELAARFVSRYCDASGDLEALRLLDFYRVYRAMVRAKVAALRMVQEGLLRPLRTRAQADCESYLAYAAGLTDPRRGALLVTHGLSGSGKTVLSQHLLEALGAFRLRSDVMRKHLHGLEPHARSGSAVGSGLYHADASAATYRALAEIARELVVAGQVVLIDAACLRRAQRDLFRELARETGVPLILLDCQAPPSLLRERIAVRMAAASDASEADLAVLADQLESAESLEADEMAQVLRFDSANDTLQGVEQRLRKRLERLP